MKMLEDCINELEQLRAENAKFRKRCEEQEKKIATAKADALKEPEWIVNDLGELGVEINGRQYFLYKGESIEYKTGLHDDGTPMLYRCVGKREFGETQWPDIWLRSGLREDRYQEELIYTPGLSFGSPDDPKFKWKPLPSGTTLKEQKP